MTSPERFEAALDSIETELNERSKWFANQGKELERYRLEQKTEYDLEMLREIGHCQSVKTTPCTLMAVNRGSARTACSTFSLRAPTNSTETRRSTSSSWTNPTSVFHKLAACTTVTVHEKRVSSRTGSACQRPPTIGRSNYLNSKAWSPNGLRLCYAWRT